METTVATVVRVVLRYNRVSGYSQRHLYRSLHHVGGQGVM